MIRIKLERYIIPESPKPLSDYVRCLKLCFLKHMEQADPMILVFNLYMSLSSGVWRWQKDYTLEYLEDIRMVISTRLLSNRNLQLTLDGSSESEGAPVPHTDFSLDGPWD